MTSTGYPIKWQKSSAEIAAEQVFIFEQRLAGCDSPREIARRAAAHFGYNFSHETVRTRLSAEISHRVEPLAAEYKQLGISRTEARIQRLAGLLSAAYARDADPEICLKIEDRIANAEVHLAKLLGTYAAVAVDVTVATNGSVDDELNALAEKLGLNDRPAHA